MVHQVERGQVSAVKVGINTLMNIIEVKVKDVNSNLNLIFYGGNYEIYILEC